MPTGKINYNLSEDYNFLWDEIQKGIRYAGYIDIISDGCRLNDLVEINQGNFNGYSIGTRGIGYNGFGEKDEFLIRCRELKLKFIKVATAGGA
jgi:hypothetical protein